MIYYLFILKHVSSELYSFLN